MTLRIAALASGTGSNVAALARHCEEGRLDATIAIVLSNNPDAPVLDFARSKGLPVWAESHTQYTREEFDTRLIAAITEAKVDVVVLAGYMRLVSPAFICAFSGRILNIHPALLPAFPGAHGGRDAECYGVRLTGCTVHFVDEVMDNGPIIIQAAIPVLPGETENEFMPRVHALEHRIYPQALQWLAEGRLSIEGRRVLLAPPSQSTIQPTAMQQSASATCTLPGCTTADQTAKGAFATNIPGATAPATDNASATCTLPGCTGATSTGATDNASSTCTLPGCTTFDQTAKGAFATNIPGATAPATDNASATCTLPGCTGATSTGATDNASSTCTLPGCTTFDQTAKGAFATNIPGATAPATTAATDTASATCTLPGCTTSDQTAKGAFATNIPGATAPATTGATSTGATDNASATCTLPGCTTSDQTAKGAFATNIPGATLAINPALASTETASRISATSANLLLHPGIIGKNLSVTTSATSTPNTAIGPCLVCPPLERF